MATLDESERQFQPLDVNTPVVDRLGLPTPSFVRGQQKFRKVLLAQSRGINANTASIVQEGLVRATADEAIAQTIETLTATVGGNTSAISEERTARSTADTANALIVDRATAEALGFSAAIMVKAEVGIAPSGVLVRYQIVASLNPGGALVQTGLYMDIVPDGSGGYLGQITLDADKIRLGRAGTTGQFPFYLDGDTVYIDTAVIRSLTIGNQKIMHGAITGLYAVISNEQVTYFGDGLLQSITIEPEGDGLVVNCASHTESSGSGTSRATLLLLRNGSVVASNPIATDDEPTTYNGLNYIEENPTNATYEFRADVTSGGMRFRRRFIEVHNGKR